MASSTLLKFGPALSRRCNLAPLSFQARHIQGGNGQGVTDAVKRGVNDTLKAGEDLKNTVENVFDKGNNEGGGGGGVAEQAKQVAQNAWESTKEGLTSESVTAVEVDGPHLQSKDDEEMAKRTKKDHNC